MSISAYASFWLGINSAFGFWQLKDRNKFNLATTNVSSNEEKGYMVFRNYYELFPHTSRHFHSPNPLTNFFLRKGLTMYPWRALNSERSTCLCLPTSGIKCDTTPTIPNLTIFYDICFSNWRIYKIP